MSACACDEKPPGVVGVATSGIQDVSALLPLLGTEQCERLVSSALRRGFLYAAATPMSIFGSLGVARAGFVVLWGSIDSRWFPGPSLLCNAGFTPAGIGALLVHVAEDDGHLYVAEDKVRSILTKKQIRSITVNLRSKDLILWNAKLVFATSFLSIFGLLPYVFLITRYLPDQPFQATWLYPILRIVGCDVVAISIQFIFQFRIIEETYCRIRFMATDVLLKDHGKSLPPFWDPNEPAKSTLEQLRRHGHINHAFSDIEQRPVPNQTPAPVQRRNLTVAQQPDPSSIDEFLKEHIQRDPRALSSFSFPSYVSPNSEQPPFPPPAPPTPAPRDPPQNASVAEKAPTEPQPGVSAIRSASHILTTTFFLCACQVALLFGLVLSVVGYIGCFSVVQASPRADTKGALVWLVCEALLAIIRTLGWAANPKWDDPKSPIVLEKVVETTVGNGANVQKKTSYSIGWMLDSVTADNIHALIVGINQFGSDSVKDLKQCVRDARRVAEYLEDTLMVPRDQIVTLYDSDATKARITQELQALAHKASVLPDAPIVIYLATHSGDEQVEGKNRTYLITHRGDRGATASLVGEENGAVSGASEDMRISYDSIVDMLGHIAQKKTDNITLILDTCYAGAMGKNENFGSTVHPEPLRDSRPTFSRGMDLQDGSLGKEPDGGFANVLGLGSDLSAKGLPRTHSDNHLTARGFRMRRMKPTPEVLVGYSSHILIAGTDSKTSAQERPGRGGLFTASLIETLKESKTVEEMTYKTLVEEINRKLEKENPEVDQRAICTSIYKNRLLFNGMLSRRVSEKGIEPVITVQYSDR